MKKIIKYMLIILIIGTITCGILYFTGVISYTPDAKLNEIKIEETQYIGDYNTNSNLDKQKEQTFNFLKKLNDGDICWYKEDERIELGKEYQRIKYTKECYLPEREGIIVLVTQPVCIGVNDLNVVYYAGTYSQLYGININKVSYYAQEISKDTFDPKMFSSQFVNGIKVSNIEIQNEVKAAKMSTAEYQEERIESEVSWCVKHDTSIEEFKQNCSFKYENGNYLLSANPSGYNEISIETDGQTYISIESNYATEKYYINEKEKCQYLIDYFNKYTFKKSSNEEDYSRFDVAKYKEKLVEEMKNNIPKNQTYEVKEDGYELSKDIYLSQELTEDRCCATTQVIGVINNENSIKFSYSVKIFFDIDKMFTDYLINVSENSITYSITDEYISHVEINRKELTDTYNIKINKLFIDIGLNDDGTYQIIYELDYVIETNNLEFSFKGVEKSTGTYTKTLNDGQVMYSNTPLTREKNITISNFKFKDDFNNLYIMPTIIYKTNEVKHSQDIYYFETIEYIENTKK